MADMLPRARSGPQWDLGRRSRAIHRRAGHDEATVPDAIPRFLLASVAAFAVIAVGGYLALRQVALDQAVRETRQDRC